MHVYNYARISPIPSVSVQLQILDAVVMDISAVVKSVQDGICDFSNRLNSIVAGFAVFCEYF
jgi:hypothetical protein